MSTPPRLRSSRWPQIGLSLGLGLSPACLEPPSADLDGPKVVASTLEGHFRVETPVVPDIVVDFSEPLDRTSVHGGAVVLVAWEAVGDCRLTPICAVGICGRGTCWEDPLGAGDRSAVDDGEFAEGIAVELRLEPGPGGPDSRLRVEPLRPLAGHTRHSLVIGAGLRDRSGAPLLDEHGEIAAWQRSFVTAAPGSSGPELELVSPAPGATGVPTNLAVVDLASFPPLPLPQADARVSLEADDGGEPVQLVDPEPCPGWVPGTCVRMRPSATLRPGVRYRPAEGSLVDRLGRRSRLAGVERETWFATGAGPDLDPPTPAIELEWRGRCLVASVGSEEALAIELEVDGVRRSAALSPPFAELGLALDGIAPGDSVTWNLRARDLADNQSELSGALAAGPSFAAELPRVAITELLANPLGPEPDAEFVELLALAGPEGAASVELAGLWLSDIPFSEVEAAWARGEDPPGDALPAVELAVGELALVVGEGWAPGLGEDPAPAIGTALARVDASLGSGGLKNAGEALSLWTMGEGGPVEIAGYGNWIDTGASASAGVSVVGDATGCDLSAAWRAHPQGRSSPGALP